MPEAVSLAIELDARVHMHTLAAMGRTAIEGSEGMHLAQSSSLKKR